MTITPETHIGDIVADDYRTAAVFSKYGIDYCCNGQRSLATACQTASVTPPELIEQLVATNQAPATTQNDYAGWPIDLLADYIEKKHHRYVEKALRDIPPLLQKIVRVHGENHPELAEVEKLFLSAAAELASHMKKEEGILFPYVREMTQNEQSGQAVSPPFGTVKNPIAVMMHEHDTEGERFRRIAKLTNNYTPPADACTTYKVTYEMLKAFEEDLHLHIHLENNVLFPKATAMENALK